MFGLMDLETGEVKSSEDQNEYGLNGYLVRRKASYTVAVPKDYINYWESGHKCEHEGCFKDGSVECHVPSDIQCDPNIDVGSIEHFCQDHAYESGYCTLCGEFWGGIELFDINNPSHLCEHCQEQIADEDCCDDEFELYYDEGDYP